MTYYIASTLFVSRFFTPHAPPRKPGFGLHRNPVEGLVILNPKWQTCYRA